MMGEGAIEVLRIMTSITFAVPPASLGQTYCLLADLRSESCLPIAVTLA